MSGTLMMLTRPGFDRDGSSVVDSIALSGPGRVSNDLGSRRGFVMPRAGFRGSVEERFWASVKRAPGDACWEWQKGRTAKGYGRMKVGGRNVMIGAVALRLDGRPLAPGECALHHCDNPPCARASHLFAGTRADNNADRQEKGRGIKGTQVNTNRLTEEQVREVRRLRDIGYSQQRLGAMFGVPHSTIGYIVRRETWAWLEDSA